MFNKRELKKIPYKKSSRVKKMFDEVPTAKVVIEFSKQRADGKNLLIINFHIEDEKLFRMFICKKNQSYEWITLTPTNNWSYECPYNLSFKSKCMYGYGFIYLTRFFSNYAVIDKKFACDFFKIPYETRNIIYEVNKILLKIKERNKEEKAISEKKSLDKFFAKLPPLSNAQKRWGVNLHNVSAGFFKGKSITCSHCNNIFSVEEKPKAKKIVKCPKCKKSLELHSYAYTGRSKKSECAFYISRIGHKAVIRHFRIYENYENQKKDFIFLEFARDIVDGKKLKKYSLNEYGEWQRGRFFDYDSFFHTSNYLPGKLYRNNLKSALKGTSIQYSGLQQYKDEKLKWDMYVNAYLKYPQLEMLVKTGCFNLVENIVEAVEDKRRGYICCDKELLKILNRNATTPKNFLNINSHQFEMIKQGNLSKTELKSIISINNQKMNISDKDLILLMPLSDKIDMFKKASEDTKVSVHKIIKYIISQLSFENPKTFYTELKALTCDYFDYLDSCRELNLDLHSKRVCFPENLPKAHNDICEVVYSQNNKEVLKKYKECYEKTLCNISNIKIDNLFFHIPETHYEYVRQGNILDQCVARVNYFERVAKQEEIIVFICKSDTPNVPYLTMEIKNGQKVQCRGKNNAFNIPDAEEFTIDKYLSFVNNHIDFTDGLKYVENVKHTTKVA